MPEKTTFRDSALRAVAIIGLIAILVLGAWGIIQLVVGLPDFFSNFGNAPSSSQSAEQIKVNPPALVTSGQPFTLAWVHTGGSGNYSFAISYSCATNLMFAAPVPTGQYQQVPCNTPFNYTSATGNVQLVAVLPQGAAQQVNTTITVTATRLSDNKITSTGSSTITVLSTKSAATTPTNPTPKPTPKPASTYTPSGRTSNLYGNADLAVQILSAQPVNGRYQVQFQISNVGTNVTPYGWEFQAQLPLNPTYTYQSQTQQKLYPGDRIIYTLGFDMANMGSAYTYNTYPYTTYPNSNCGYTQNYTYDGYANYPTTPTYSCNTASAYNAYPNYYANQPNYYGSQFSVTADPQYLVNDSNRSNNTASVMLSN